MSISNSLGYKAFPPVTTHLLRVFYHLLQHVHILTRRLGYVHLGYPVV